jgi:deazaflavin-dependent oxidoreductase (nitroreductase family)
MQVSANGVPRTPLLRAWVNKPPNDVREPAGWHHGWCRPCRETLVGKEKEEEVVSIRSSRRSVVSYEDANPFHRLMRWQAATAPMSRLWARTLHHLDRLVFRLTKGRHTFVNLVSGLPVVMLTTTGAKSRKPRTLPVLGIPDGERMGIIASNWGQRRHPSWYHNLRTNPRASISVEGVSSDVLAYEAEGEERDRLWQRGLEVYPGWVGYERRASNRRIPIMVLTPSGTQPTEEMRTT